jgi:hypothetical protein
VIVLLDHYRSRPSWTMTILWHAIYTAVSNFNSRYGIMMSSGAHFTPGALAEWPYLQVHPGKRADTNSL